MNSRPTKSHSASEAIGEDARPPYAAVLEAEGRDEVFSLVAIDVPNDQRPARYSDPRWDLSPLERGRASLRTTIDFAKFPAQFVSTAKRITWVWINADAPVHKLHHPSKARSRLSPITISASIKTDVSEFFWFLDAKGKMSLAEVSERDLEEFRELVINKPWVAERKGRMLFSITRIWLSGFELPPPEQLRCPPWEIEGIPWHEGRSSSAGENRTVPIHPLAMAATLDWALRFVNDLSDDILRAIEDRRGLRDRAAQHPRKQSTTVFRTYLDELRTTNQPLPGRVSPVGVAAAREYIAGTLGIHVDAIHRRLYKDIEVRLGAPLDTTINAHLPGEDAPWLASIDFYEVPLLRSLLATACLVVVSYLSGMRGNEVAELRRGCCTKIKRTGEQPAPFIISGFEYKTARDEEGNQVLGGRERKRPWTVIEPVARAIHLAETLSQSDYVFDQGIFRVSSDEIRNRPCYAGELTGSVKSFIAWINEYCTTSGQSGYRIPDDPSGPINMRRFRRTLAWFIYRQPGGRVALGIQYGHLQGKTTDGYGIRANNGVRGLYPMEEALALVDSLNDAAERLMDGESVSGPAADRYVAGVGEFGERFAGRRLTSKQLTALGQNPRMRIYDNDLQPLACCYDQAKSLCHPGNNRGASVNTTPDLTRCDPRCGNIARTDRHIERLRQEAADCERQIASGLLAEPLEERFRQRIETLTTIVEEHENTKARP